MSADVAVSYSALGHRYVRGAGEGKNIPGTSLFSVTEQVVFPTPLIQPATWC